MWRVASPRRALVELISPCRRHHHSLSHQTLPLSVPLFGVPEIDMRGRVYVSAGRAEQGGVGAWGQRPWRGAALRYPPLEPNTQEEGQTETPFADVGCNCARGHGKVDFLSLPLY